MFIILALAVLSVSQLSVANNVRVDSKDILTFNSYSQVKLYKYAVVLMKNGQQARTVYITAKSATEARKVASTANPGWSIARVDLVK
jgi:hypothetical protein